MATYQPIPPGFEQLNDAQKNEVAISLGYTGLNDLRDNANKQKQGGGGTNSQIGGGSGGGLGLGGGLGTAPAPLDLNALYDKLTTDSGIGNSQAELDALSKQAADRLAAQNAATAKINDNPFYSEGTRVGRVAKLNDIGNADQTLLLNKQKVVADQISQKKADVQMKLSIAKQQFDINSAAATDALNKFNTLLASGALANASGADIAALTTATGLSSTMIQSAINAAKAKNVNTSTIQYDDGINQGFLIINSDTGEIIKKEIVAASKPAKSGGSGSGGLTDTQQRAVTATARKSIANVDTNADKSLSLKEFQQAIQDIMSSTGVDQGTAEQQAAQAMSDLGFTTWHWNQ